MKALRRWVTTGLAMFATSCAAPDAPALPPSQQSSSVGRAAEPPAPPTASTQLAAGMRWALVCGNGAKTRLVDWTTGESVTVGADPLPDPAFDVQIDGATWGVWFPSFSPDGKGLLGTAYLASDPSAGRIVWRSLPDGDPVVVPGSRCDDRWPVWSGDSRRLLFQRTPADRSDADSGQVMVRDVVTGTTVPFHDQELRLLPLPVLDRDGRWIHMRRRFDGTRQVNDVAVCGGDPGQRAEVLITNAPEAQGLEMSSDGTTLWLVGLGSLWRYERRSGKLTHSWLDLSPGAMLCISSWFLRPDGGGIVVELLPAFEGFATRGSWHATVVVEMSSGDGLIDTARITRSVERDWRDVRGFVATPWPPR